MSPLPEWSFSWKYKTTNEARGCLPKITTWYLWLQETNALPISPSTLIKSLPKKGNRGIKLFFFEGKPSFRQLISAAKNSNWQYLWTSFSPNFISCGSSFWTKCRSYVSKSRWCVSITYKIKSSVQILCVTESLN